MVRASKHLYRVYYTSKLATVQPSGVQAAGNPEAFTATWAATRGSPDLVRDALGVASGFARFVVGSGAAHPLLPGVRWVWEALPSFDARDWNERNLEENLVGILRACWQREAG